MSSMPGIAPATATAVLDLESPLLSLAVGQNEGLSLGALLSWLVICGQFARQFMVSQLMCVKNV